jgi:hypothetical protein
MVVSKDSSTHREATMNAPKTVVESDLAFETAWSQLESECAAAGVEIVGAEKVRSYLQDHSDMFTVTGQICSALRREFGSDAALKLSLFIDCENNDRWLRLGVGIANRGVEILDRYRAITAAFEEELYQASGEISVTSDYVRGR